MAETLPQTIALLEQGITEGHHIGAQLYVSRGGEVIADHAVGEASAGETLTPDHLTLWLSAGKPITALAIMQLVEEGSVALDDPVAKHIPEFAQQGKDAITIRHLLMHTAGIRVARFNYPDDDWQTIIDAICAVRPEPRWEPGQKAGYHPHTSWYILGEILRRVTGKRFSLAIRERVLEPAGMQDSWLGMPSMKFYKYGTRIATMPDTSVDHTKRADAPFHTMPWCVNVRPGGNAYGPARELGQFFEILLNDGRTSSGEQLLGAPLVQDMKTRHRQGMTDHTFKYTVDWGLGLILNSYEYAGDEVPYQFGPHASRETFGHGGSQSSIAFADPKHKLTVVIICLGRPGEEANRLRMNELTKTIYWELGLG